MSAQPTPEPILYHDGIPLTERAYVKRLMELAFELENKARMCSSEQREAALAYREAANSHRARAWEVAERIMDRAIAEAPLVCQCGKLCEDHGEPPSAFGMRAMPDPEPVKPCIWCGGPMDALGRVRACPGVGAKHIYCSDRDY